MSAKAIFGGSISRVVFVWWGQAKWFFFFNYLKRKGQCLDEGVLHWCNLPGSDSRWKVGIRSELWAHLKACSYGHILRPAAMGTS